MFTDWSINSLKFLLLWVSITFPHQECHNYAFEYIKEFGSVSEGVWEFKEKSAQVKDRVASTLRALDEKPHKDDEAGKNEIQYKRNMALVLVQFWNN